MRRLFRHFDHLVSRWGAGLDEAVRVVRPGGWIGIVHWANPQGADIFSILSRALKKLPLPTDSPDRPKVTVIMSVHELRDALEARECEVMDVERLDAPSPLPTPESFMDMLNHVYRTFATYRSLGEHLRGLLVEQPHGPKPYTKRFSDHAPLTPSPLKVGPLMTRAL